MVSGDVLQEKSVEFWVKVSGDEFGSAIVTTVESLKEKFNSVTLVVGDRQENILKKYSVISLFLY